ncbi:WecB/TagA/CpsF family glycosyltransferase [Cognatishimia sp. SS12]|uniref:WecB/TagA/CpsF family glycosyltransferase n=1 Tax=Cognatishimia sp. SS12 TaxID=2979465 RepID=UPI00232AEB3B|nr:WecB/TagA/CpsF family glycosyltransferase [Cognatishimia sp. SS12]MDC0736825.1 WecB/TagA/CpsF family glycosyltransferase [Cognatishimia sp. SS12]
MAFETANGEIAINVPTRAHLQQCVQEKFAQDQGFALATLNLDHLVKMNADPAFYAAYQAQDLVVADGRPIVWLSKLAGTPIELVPGSDLCLPLARWAALAGKSVAFLGSTDAALKGAADTMRSAVPGLEIAAMIAPPFGFDPDGPEAAAALKEIESSGAALCFLALGAPKQERLAARGRELTPGIGYASIGAGLDFLAGHQTRAPKWARALAIEWFWRMMSNPKRLFKRYMLCFAILPAQVTNALRQRRAARR